MAAGDDLTQGPIGPHLVRLTVPMFLGVASMMIASMIDSIYVGLIGTVELAAVSFVFPLIMALTQVAMGVGMGASSLIARMAGGGDAAAVRSLSTHAMLLACVLVLPLTGLGYLFLDDLLRLLGARDELLAHAGEYMRVWLIGLPLFSLPMVATSIIRATGNARLPGAIMLLGSGLQVVVAPVLIFGVPGVVDGLGFAGAAWSFVLSRAGTLIWTVRVLFGPLALVDVSRPRLADVRASWTAILAIAVPSTATTLIGPVSMAIVIALLTPHGAGVLAGYGLASRFDALAMMVLMSLAGSTGPFVGQNYGAGRRDRVEAAQHMAYRFSVVWAVIAFVFMALVGDHLIAAINDDPIVVASGYQYLLIVSLSMGLLGVGSVAGSTFMALGHALPNLLMSLARAFVVYLPLAWLGDQLFGYLGIYWATAAANVVMGIVAALWVRRLLAGIAFPAPRAVAVTDSH